MDRVLLPARGLNMWIEISMPEPARDPLLHRSSEDGATARAAAGMWVAFAADCRGKCPPLKRQPDLTRGSSERQQPHRLRVTAIDQN
jgi:hypothetical protein